MTSGQEMLDVTEVIRTPTILILVASFASPVLFSSLAIMCGDERDLKIMYEIECLSLVSLIIGILVMVIPYQDLRGGRLPVVPTTTSSSSEDADNVDKVLF